MPQTAVPRLPVFGWQALRGHRGAGIPCMLDRPQMRFTTSGRAAILLALEALQVDERDKVLLPTYHCPTMVAPVVHLRAQACFYPIDARGAPDLQWLETQDLRGVRVMLAAHYFGLPQPMGEVRRWCERHGIALIEDCAHALFGQAGERPIGCWGDIAIGSLTKFLPVPEGGCMVVNGHAATPELDECGTATQVRAAVDILQVGAAQRRLPGLNTPIAWAIRILRKLRGRPLAADRLSAPALEAGPAGGEASGSDLDIDAATAHRQLAWSCQLVAAWLPRARIVQNRRRHYERLLVELGDRAGLRPLIKTLPAGCAPYVFPLWFDAPDPAYAELRRLGMPVFRWDKLWPGVPRWPHDHGTKWSHHVIQLACHQDMSPEDLSRFISHVRRVALT